MHAIAIALVGLFAIAGTPAPEVSAPIAEAAEVATTTLAVATPTSVVRASGEEELLVKLTSYNAVPEQTDHNPNLTASGARSNPEVIAARSVDLAGTLPYGTIVAITRESVDSENCRFGAVEHLIGYRVIGDSMHSRKRQQVDVLLNQADTVPVHGIQTNPSLALGVCIGVSVRVIGKVALSDIPETQEDLRALVEDDTFALR